MAGLLEGKQGLVLGVANDRSIAWYMAKRLHAEGARLAFTYQNEKTGQYVLPLFEQVESSFSAIMDVTDEAQMSDVLGRMGQVLGGRLDFIIHAVAGGPRKGELSGRYLDTSREGFIDSMLVSVYSLSAVVRACLPLMGQSGSIITMSYYGAEKVVTNYNVMGVAKAALESSVRYLAADLGPLGIRVNALSPGTLMTRAASGIGDFERLMAQTAGQAPLRRNVTKEEVADAALFLVSSLSTGITGQTVHVDGGQSAVGVHLPGLK